MAKARSTQLAVTPTRWVAAVAAIALVVHIAVLWLLEGGMPDPYALGQVVGVHLAAFLVTALVASITRLGSVGAMVAVYLLAFAAFQVLLVITELR
ncbi:MAG: hypothetical protein OEW91_07540 [Acidimicrobiia bacterium]|nr:hypothetical protein [Acidimicrobiia bacterium]